MIINPTKKALPIFNKLAKVEDSAAAKTFAIGNQFFSWHTNYYSLNRKKVVILVNDLTYATVVLYDINAKNKVNLDQHIKDGIRAAFSTAGITDKEIDTYFEIAGDIQINAGFNRQVTGVITNMIMMAEGGLHTNPEVLVQVELMDWLMHTSYNKTVNGIKAYVHAKDAIKKAFKNNLTIIESSEIEAAGLVYKLEKTWRGYHKWDKYEDDQALIKDGKIYADDLTRYEQVMNEVQANNKFLMAEFKKFLTDSEGLSKKVVNKHVDNVDTFVNEYLLYYTIKTPLKLADGVFDYLADWYPRKIAYSPADLKATGAGLKKFVKFMAAAGEIDKSDVEIAKESINNGVEMGVEHIEMVDSMTDFW